MESLKGKPTVSAPERSRRGDEQVTALLQRWRAGDEQAGERLLQAVYQELRRLAGSYLRRERKGHTLSTSALVHEAYLRLLDQRLVDWQSRRHFFGIAAQAMRRILVDHARRRLYQKRGGSYRRIELAAIENLSAARAPELVALDAALDSLATISAEQARIVELRYFAGLDREEIARLLGTSPRTVDRRWRMARAWLYHQLRDDHDGGS